MRPQAGFNITQTFPRRELREGQAAKLVKAGKMLDLVFAALAGHATAKDLPGQMIHHLREHVLPPYIERLAIGDPRKGRRIPEKFKSITPSKPYSSLKIS